MFLPSRFLFELYQVECEWRSFTTKNSIPRISGRFVTLLWISFAPSSSRTPSSSLFQHRRSFMPSYSAIRFLRPDTRGFLFHYTHSSAFFFQQTTPRGAVLWEPDGLIPVQLVIHTLPLPTLRVLRVRANKGPLEIVRIRRGRPEEECVYRMGSEPLP